MLELSKDDNATTQRPITTTHTHTFHLIMDPTPIATTSSTGQASVPTPPQPTDPSSDQTDPPRVVDTTAVTSETVLGKRSSGVTEVASDALRAIDTVLGSNVPTADKQSVVDVITRLTEASLETSERLKHYVQIETESKLAALAERLHVLGLPNAEDIMKRATDDPRTRDDLLFAFGGIPSQPSIPVATPPPQQVDPPQQPPVQQQPPVSYQQQPPQTQPSGVSLQSRIQLEDRIRQYNQATRTPPTYNYQAYTPPVGQPYPQQSMGLNAQLERAFSGHQGGAPREIAVQASQQSSMSDMQILARQMLRLGAGAPTPTIVEIASQQQ